jgi:predicted ArsR family transcriptional regulator
MTQNIEQQSETRKAILMALKQNGSETIASLVSKLKISNEGVRLHLVQLERDGLIERHTERSGPGGGRPAIKVCLTSKGETLFPKQYNALTVELIDTVADQLGLDAVKKVLSTMIDARVREWAWRLEGLSLEDRVAALKDLYMMDDQYMEIENSNETFRLIERNCPFYDVAIQRPILCNVTLSTLSRLLGCKVEREKSFQNGDGCCVFVLKTDKPVEESSTPILLEWENLNN